MSNVRFSAIALATAFLDFATMADAAPYSTSGVSSAVIAPSGDAIGLAPGLGTLTVPGIYALNAGTWDISDSGALITTITGSLSETLAVNGSTIAISVPYTLDVSATQDTFTIDPGATYLVGGANLTLLGTGALIATSLGSIPFTVNADLTSVPVAVPEPVSLALLGIGLAGLGLIRRRRG
jgi:hypothetical protein